MTEQQPVIAIPCSDTSIPTSHTPSSSECGSDGLTEAPDATAPVLDSSETDSQQSHNTDSALPPEAAALESEDSAHSNGNLAISDAQPHASASTTEVPNASASKKQKKSKGHKAQQVVQVSCAVDARVANCSS